MGWVWPLNFCWLTSAIVQITHVYISPGEVKPLFQTSPEVDLESRSSDQFFSGL